MKRQLILSALFAASITHGAFAQDKAPQRIQDQDRTIAPIGDRSGMPIPKNLLDLKNLSLAFWVKFRGTNQQVYRYINEAAAFHAYAHVCKRHELNLTLGPITELSHKYVQAAIPAHYEEPEFELLEPLSKAKQQEFLDDMAGDVYAFEYGFRSSELQGKIQATGKTRQSYCADVEKEYKDSYIALRATAQRRLAEFSGTNQ